MLFPTHVGVSLDVATRMDYTAPLPHTRGGVPKRTSVEMPHQNSSPHTWGCPYRQYVSLCRNWLFPTHVGVSLCEHGVMIPSTPLPHTRGGVPYLKGVQLYPHCSSPHTWGCPWAINIPNWQYLLFPTHVGVSLLRLTRPPMRLPLPHTRGGVPLSMSP